ncbi:MAG: restriction endonuclease subunit S [bacterium]|nr:restriction endonuclease subunit S [bacterium]
MSWRRTPLGEHIDLISGPAFKSAHFTADPEDVPLVKGENLGQGQILWAKSKYWPRADTEKYERFFLEPHDVVLAMDRPWVPAGLKFAAVPPDAPRALLVQRVARIRPASSLTSAFLRYVIASPEFCAYVKNIMGGVGVPHISGDQIRRFEFSLPPLPEQHAIADLLSAYDDLIQNNRRRIQLLELSVRLLFKEWFVHLRFPGHEHVKIVDGVPEGWARRSLNDVADFRLGKMLDQKKNKGEPRPYLANKNVRWGEFDFSELREMRFEESETEKYGLKHGDILMCEGGEPGRCAIWRNQLPGMMFQKALHRIRPSGGLDSRFLFHSLLFKGRTGRLAGLFTGATIKHLPREKLAKVEIDIPTVRLMELFLENAGPLEDQINVLQTGIRRASAARDLLLPRLMSGEIAA